MNLLYFAPFGMATGYGRAAADYVMALTQAGARVAIRGLYDTYDRGWTSETTEGVLLEWMKAPMDMDEVDAVIVHDGPHAAAFTVPNKLPPRDHVPRFLLTTWETTKLPEYIARALRNRYDFFAVPSDVTKESFAESGITPHVLPHCFDPTLWSPKQVLDGHRPYRFYSIGAWNERKNPMGLLTAYLSEFYDDKANVNLSLHTTDTYNEDALTRHIELAMNLNVDKCPEFDVLSASCTSEEIVNMHYDNDCYVTASRGEAWGLGAFEAACVGNPTIVPEYGGMVQYLDDLHGSHWTIDCTFTPAVARPLVKKVNGVDALVRVVPEGVDATQMWGEPSIADLRIAMRAAYSQRIGTRDEEPHNHKTRQLDCALLAAAFGYDSIGADFIAWVEGRRSRRDTKEDDGAT